MKEINIYYGPKRGFQNVLPKRTKITTLTELAIKSDSKRQEYIVKVPGQDGEQDKHKIETPEKVKCLVAFSEEYAGISEHTIQNFISFIARYDLEKLYLQNPPLYIVQQLEKISKKIITKTFSYESVNTDVLHKINDGFSTEIFGQEGVKDYLLTALYPLVKLDFKKPIVFLFYGPTGVGKTETAKFLSKMLGEKLFRKQFSMYHNEDFSSYLFGGKHSQNCFAKELLERESNIILLDEFDKPHPVFHSAFYQLFDEGTFEDKNYSVTLNKAIIICTSNYTSEEDVKNKLGDPIFSRFDAVIKFAPLSLEATKQVICMQYDLQYSLLTFEEKKLIDKEDLKPKILYMAKSMKNVRQIKSIIQQAISTLLVRELMRIKI